MAGSALDGPAIVGGDQGFPKKVGPPGRFGVRFGGGGLYMVHRISLARQ